MARPTAACSSPAPPARARRRRCTRRSTHVNTGDANDHHRRGPGRVPAWRASSRCQVNPKVGMTFAERPAGDHARGPRHHHGRRDPRPRDGADRRGGRADRPPRPLDAAHHDAPDAVSRLLDMGVEPFLLSSAIDCVVAQRLARRLCQHCARPQRKTVEELRLNGLDVAGRHGRARPRGCDRCNGTGYKGRVGIFEVLSLDEDIRRLVLARARPTRSPLRRPRPTAAAAACARTACARSPWA